MVPVKNHAIVFVWIGYSAHDQSVVSVLPALSLFIKSALDQNFGYLDSIHLFSKVYDIKYASRTAPKYLENQQEELEIRGRMETI